MPRPGKAVAVAALIISFSLASLVSTSPLQVGEAKAAIAAHKVIGDFQAALLDTMKKAKFSNVEDRYKAMEPHIDTTFHVPIMARIVTGKYWGDSSKEQRVAFANAFRRYNIAYIASLLYTYSGQNFEFVREKPGPQGTMIVETVLKDPDGSVVNIAYVMREYAGEWRAIDVILDRGISELKLRQSEYRAVLSKDGLTGLTAILDSKVAELLAE